MNKIYKVMYSKVKQCCVVVSEIAKSHGRHTKRSVAKSSAALTAGVLIALGSFSFEGMPVVQAADGTESLRNNDFVGANDYYWYYDEKEKDKDKKWKTYQYKATDIFNNRSRHDLPNYQGGGAKLPGAITAGLYAQAGQQTVTIGDRNAGQSKGSVFIGEHSGYNNGDNAPAGMKNNYVTSVGFQSDATGWGSIAIGSNATAENSKMESQVVEEVGNANTSGTVSDDTYGIKENPTIQGASVALGYNAHSKDGNIAIGSYSDATSTDKNDSYVSVGNANLKRRITNVAEGTNASDVATVGQLMALEAKSGTYKAGFGIEITPDTTTKENTIKLSRNLGRDMDSTDKATLVADESKSALVLGGRVEEGQSKKGQIVEKPYGAFGQDSVVVGGVNNIAAKDGVAAVVIGGTTNTASAQYSTVAGGNNNDAFGNESSVFGGFDNDAFGAYATLSGGSMNRAYGAAASVFGGGVNSALGDSSVAVGGLQSTVNGTFAVGIAGGSTNADYALAAGNGANVTVENGTAIGYQATTDEAGTIAFGHDAGDAYYSSTTWPQKATKQNGKYYDANNKEISKAKYDALKNSDGTWNDYSKTPTVVEKTYDKAAYNRLVKVADGQDDHDVVVMEQLKQYAEKNAGNIGNNLTVIPVYQTDDQGNIKLGSDNKPLIDKEKTEQKRKDDQTTNKNDWGLALGADSFTAGTATTATDASTSDQLVTGKTLYNYDAPVAETGKNLNYVNANYTTGQNLSALDAQVQANADALDNPNHNIKYYSVKTSSLTVDGYTNEKNDGAKGMGSIAAGFVTHADGIASTVAGSYSGIINSRDAQGTDLRGAAALSYGTFNVNQNTDTAKEHSGVANSIVGQANMTTNSNAAIIYGAGNTVTDSYRPIVSKKDADILGSISDPTKLSKAMQDAVKESGGQVMVMGGGNNVESAYMSQVVGVGNTVKGNQVENTKGEWGTDTSDTAIKDYNSEKSSQYNYVDGFNNEVINGKHDYIIGANNKLSGDSYDDDKAHPNKRSNKSNIIIGDNHTLSREQNTVIIGSSDTENTQTKANDAVIIGHNANATSDTGADNAVAIGRAAKATGGNAVTIGVNTSAGENSITIGSESHANSGSNIAIGRSAQVYGYEITNAVALGQKAEAHVADGVAIGSGSIATVAGKSTEGYDPATGQNSTETTSTWKATNAAVSIGTADGKVTRQINGVAAGTNDTDAVNVAQLKSLQSGLTSNLTNTGLKFAANSGNEYTAKLGTTVKIQGTDKTEGHEYTADNLTTEIDKDGNITILMDKNVSAEKIAVNGKDGENGKPGTAGSIGISGQDGKAGVGIDGKDGISIKGQNGKDGVTIKGIDGVDGVDGAEGHIGLNGKDGMTDIFTTAGTPGLNGKDGETMTRIVYKDPKGTEHEAATLDDGLKFKGDDGKEIAKKLNNTLDIIGGAKGDLTEGNIGVNSTDKGQLKVQLAKDLKGITSISNQKTEGGKTTGAKITLGDDGSVNVNGGKITNVGSGADASGKYTETTNAANIGDVQKIAENTATGLTGKGLKFAANSGNEYTAKLGTTVKVLGTAKTEGHEYTADNLTTEIDEKGNITILMDKNVSAEKIAVNGKDGENGKPGTAGSIGISGQDGKAGVGIDGKDGISIKGQNGKDGVTIKGIDGVDGVDGAEGHIGLNGKDGMTDIFTTAGTPGLNGKDGETMTRIVYKDPKGTEHEAATLDDGLKFKGDDGKEIAKKLNNTLDIIGGAKGDLTEGNIGVNNDSGKLKVQLAKDLTGITSISNQTTTKVGGKDVTTGAKVTLGADGSVDVNGGKITHVGSGADASGNYTTTTNAANIGDVQKIVKDAVDSAADTTNKALAGKANVDASNIGANLKGEDGKTPATEAEKAKNENAWGSAIGTGKIEANNGQLVTGKTVYEYNKPVAEDGKTLNYVSEGKTTGQNLGALDAQVKNNADAIKKNSESIQNITNNVKNLSDNAVQYDKDSNKAKVTLGGDGGTTITNVKDGALSENSSDAVNGKQLYAEQQAREKADAEINQKVTNNTNEITKIKNGDFTDASKTAIHNIAKNAVKVVDGKNTTVTTVDGTDTTPTTYAVNVEGTGEVASGDKGLISGDTIYNELRPSADGSYIKKDSTTAQNLVSLDTQVKKTSDLIYSDGKTIKIGGSDAATKIDVNGKDGKGRVITGVVSDANDPTSAANVGYVNNAYGRLNNNINKAAAGSNALAALHPLDYDPDDKADFAVGYGHYRNANAAAVGAFYHPNENTMVNVGVSLGNGDPGFNAGVSFKVGRGGAGREAMSKTEMAKVINSQSKEIDALKKDNADKDKRIDALEQKMAEILAKLDKNGK